MLIDLRMLAADDIIRLCGTCKTLRADPVDRFVMLLELLQRCRWHGPRQITAWREQGATAHELLRVARRMQAEMAFLSLIPARCTVAGSYALHKFMVQEHAQGRSAGPGPPGTKDVLRQGDTSFAEWTPGDIDVFVDVELDEMLTADDELVERLVCSSLAPRMGCTFASVRRDGRKYADGEVGQDFDGDLIRDSSLVPIKAFPKHLAVALAMSCQDSRKRERESFYNLDIRELEHTLPELVGSPRAYDVVSSTTLLLPQPERAPYDRRVSLRDGEIQPSAEAVALSAAQGIPIHHLARTAVAMHVNIIRVARRRVDATTGRLDRTPGLLTPLTPLEIVSGFDQHQCAIAMSLVSLPAGLKFEGSEEAKECARAALLRFTPHVFCSEKAQRNEAIIKVLRRADRYADRGFRLAGPASASTSSRGASSGGVTSSSDNNDGWLVGTHVELHSLVSLPEHNGCMGTIVSGINVRGRLGVAVDGVAVLLSLKPANCKRVPAPPPHFHNSGPAAAKVLMQDAAFDAHTLFDLIAQSVRGWSTAAFTSVAQMRLTCSAWYGALAKVSRRLELPRAFSTLALDERRLMLMTDETIATVFDVVTGRPCSTVEHGGELARTEGFHLAAFGPTTFVKVSKPTGTESARARVEQTRYDITLTLYEVVRGPDVLGGLRLVSRQVCRLPASRPCYDVNCQAVGGRLLVACDDVLTIWHIDPWRQRIELITQLIAPECSPLSSSASMAPSIWALAAFGQGDTVVACHGDVDSRSAKVHIWNLHTGACGVLALPDVEVCAPISVHMTADSIDGWPTEHDPDLIDPPRSEAIGTDVALLMYEEAGSGMFELGAWTGRNGRYHRSGLMLKDVPRAMASLPAHALVAVAGDDGAVKLVSPSLCAFVAWPGEYSHHLGHIAETSAVTNVTAMAVGEALVIQYEMPSWNRHLDGVSHPSVVRRQEADSKLIVLWQR